MNFTDHFLIAMPGSLDPIFGGTVVYMCEHNEFGALGIVINRPLEVTLNTLLQQQGITVDDAAKPKVGDPILFGGPVQSDRGFILHTTDAAYSSTMKVSDKIAFTASRDVLEAIAKNNGPRHALVAIGYAGWDAGQLEGEISRNAWLTVQADPDMIFQRPFPERYDAAVQKLGFDPSVLVTPGTKQTLQ